MGNQGLYVLPEEHHAIREAVREIAEREIAPWSAEVDAVRLRPHPYEFSLYYDI